MEQTDKYFPDTTAPNPGEESRSPLLPSVSLKASESCVVLYDKACATFPIYVNQHPEDMCKKALLSSNCTVVLPNLKLI